MAMRLLLVLRVLVLLISSILISSCATTDLVTGKKTQNFFELKDDIDMGREGIQEVKEEFAKDGIAINQDKKTLKKLTVMVNTIASANNLTGFPFEVTLFETNIVNAMAMPGGQVLAFPGLWDEKEGIVKDDDELAAVFSHELAHVTCRHSTEALTKELPYEILLGGIGLYAEMKENDDLAVAVGAVFLLYEGLLLPKYSRIDESEADMVGMMYMAKAGYDPRSAVRLWKRVDETEGSEPAILSIFSTHPSNEHRYKALQARLPEAIAIYESSTGKKLK